MVVVGRNDEVVRLWPTLPTALKITPFVFKVYRSWRSQDTKFSTTVASTCQERGGDITRFEARALIDSSSFFHTLQVLVQQQVDTVVVLQASIMYSAETRVINA